MTSTNKTTQMGRIIAITLLLLALPGWLTAGENPLDRFMDRRLEKTKIPFPQCDDLTFIRRVWLDINGSLPSREKMDSWLESDQLDRELVVEEALLSRDFLSRWASYFDDMLEVRQFAGKHHSYAIRSMIREYVRRDTGWDEMARGILTYSGPLSMGQTSLAVWHEANGVDNTLIQDIFDDRAAYFSEKFLGIETRCISCHDGAYHLEEVNVDLTARKRSDFWGLAAFFSSATIFCPDGGRCSPFVRLNEEDVPSFVDVDNPDFAAGNGFYYDPLFIHEGGYVAESASDQGMRPARNGGLIQPRYPFNGEEPLAGETRREALARIMTADRQFARNMVNRLWHHFMGSTFVYPFEKFDLARINAEAAYQNDATVQPLDPEFLEYLTDLFIENDFRLKRFIAVICGSQIYQLDYANLPARDYGPYWGGALRVRRLEAETIVNAVSWATGITLGYVDGSGGSLRYNPWDFLHNEPDLNVSRIPSAIARLGVNTPQGITNYQIAMYEFLAIMGRGNRDQKVPRKSVIDQEAMLFMLNSPWLLNENMDRSPVIQQLFDDWQSKQLDSEQVVAEVYLRTLFRQPTAEEMTRDMAHLDSLRSRSAISDLMWRAFNAEDFLYR